MSKLLLIVVGECLSRNKNA